MTKLPTWRIDGEFDSDVTVEIIDEHDFLICELAPFDGDWTPEEIQRAHLIEAAPNLLKACKVVAAYLDALDSGTPEGDPLRIVRNAYHAPLRSVLDPAI